jgi:putative nucleotidyltransferase with HDIG domain
MRAVPRARALQVAAVGLGLVAVAVALVARSEVPLATLALLAAAAVVTEFVQVPSDSSSPAPGDAHTFSFSTCVHVATILIVGPWTGGLVAAFGVVVADRLRGTAWRFVLFNASVFALATVAGGFAFELAGGTRAGVELPGDFAALAALGATYYLVNTGLTCAMIAVDLRTPFVPLAWGSFIDGGASFAAEAGLGVAVAFLAEHEPWALAALAPLLLAVYRSYERLAGLRRETTNALETFATVVDHRDPYTFEHSVRVAGYARGLAQRLGLPLSDVERLRWAGRLHDLGKIGVDAAVLRKPGKLDDEDWTALRRHPRLSAHLLRRFRLAADEVRAVELHHERFDGRGYYGVAGSAVPLAAHVLVVADTYDAMTSDRSYRGALPKEEALAEIERNAGTQFHPAVARAFVAWQRGLDPGRVLSPAERRAFADLWGSRRGARGREALARLATLDVVAMAAIALGLVLYGAGAPAGGAAGALFATAAIAARWVERVRTERLAAGLVDALEEGDRAHPLAGLTTAIARIVPPRWAGVVAWDERDLAAVVVAGSNGAAEEPTDAALTGWLSREALSAADVAVTRDGLDAEDVEVALRLGDDGSSATYLVLVFDGRVPRRLVGALASARPSIAATLGGASEGVAAPRRLVAVR